MGKSIFSYYGSKSKIINKYPLAIYNNIIEPFAGTAQYSLIFGQDKNIHINDKYSVIYKIWNYLSQVSEDRIKSLPHIKKGEDIRDYKDLIEEELLLIGFCVGNGRSSPGYKVTAFGDKTHYPKEDRRWRPNSTWTLTRNRILKYLPQIKNWKITNLDYKDLPDIEATWFIDPPYQFGGDLYIENKINFEKLYDWCSNRKGQVIICENDKNTWLKGQFTKKFTLHGQKYKTEELYLEIIDREIIT